MKYKLRVFNTANQDCYETVITEELFVKLLKKYMRRFTKTVFTAASDFMIVLDIGSATIGPLSLDVKLVLMKDEATLEMSYLAPTISAEKVALYILRSL